MKANLFNRSYIGFVVLTLLAILLSSCGSPAAEVSVRLKWTHQTQFAGIYMADKEGYYADENLKVTIEPVDFDQMLSIDKVIEGKNTFGIGAADEVIVARANGAPVKAIAVIYRISPQVYMSIGDIKVSKPEDLIGKRVGIGQGSGLWTFNAMINKAGIDRNLITVEDPKTFDTLECAQRYDVCNAYSTDSIVKADMQGIANSAIWPGDSILRAQSGGQDLIAISSIFRKSPLMIMTLSNSGITSPQDLTGKTVGVVSTGLDTTWDIQFIAMLKKTGIDPNGIKFVPNEEFHGAADLHTGRMDASSGTFSTNELVQAKIDGEDVVSIYYGDYGVEFYNNVIFTKAQLTADNPKLVQRFIRATLQGYQYAIEHSKEAAALTIKYDETLDVAFQQATIEAQIPLIDTGDARPGWMDDHIWVNTQTILLDQGYITSPVDLSKAYTNEFIK